MAKYYAAYGSNLNISQMKRRCPDAVIHGVSFIKDHRLVYRGSKTGSYLTIEPCKGRKVPVGIWAVSPYDEKNLDRYEGYPDFYYKAGIEFTDSDGKNIKAFVYIMHEDRPYGLPSEYYVETCAEGYCDFGFDPSYLKRAYRDTKKEVSGV